MADVGFYRQPRPKPHTNEKQWGGEGVHTSLGPSSKSDKGQLDKGLLVQQIAVLNFTF